MGLGSIRLPRWLRGEGSGGGCCREVDVGEGGFDKIGACSCVAAGGVLSLQSRRKAVIHIMELDVQSLLPVPLPRQSSWSVTARVNHPSRPSSHFYACHKLFHSHASKHQSLSKPRLGRATSDAAARAVHVNPTAAAHACHSRRLASRRLNLPRCCQPPQPPLLPSSWIRASVCWSTFMCKMAWCVGRDGERERGYQGIVHIVLDVGCWCFWEGSGDRHGGGIWVSGGDVTVMVMLAVMGKVALLLSPRNSHVHPL